MRTRLGVRRTGLLAGTFFVPSAGLSGVLPRPSCPGISEEEFVARTGQRQQGARRAAPRKQQQRSRQRGDVFSELTRTAREVEGAARRGRVTPAVRSKFQAVAMLLREERARIQAAQVSAS